MKKIYILLAAAVMLVGIFVSLLGITASSCAPAVIGSQPEPSDTVAAFFEDVKAGEYEAAMEYVVNYDTLGFEKEGSELIELYKRTLIESYAIRLTEPSGAAPDSRLEAIEGIEFTHLDCRMLVQAVSEKTTEAAMDYMNDGYIIENDEQAMNFVYDALRECLSEPEQYMTTERFDILLTFDGESWKMNISEELAAAMFGYIDSLSAEGVK